MFFISLILILIVVVAIVIGAYYLVIHLIKLWTGCDNDEANAKLHNFFNGSANCTIENDSTVFTEIGDNIHKIIGEKRFQQLVNLSNTLLNTPLLFFDNNGKIPRIIITVNYEDESEKIILENILCNVFRKYLAVYGFSTEIISEWHIRSDLKTPYLQIGYAKNKEQKAALKLYMQHEQNTFIKTNSDILDDTETDDLND